MSFHPLILAVRPTRVALGPGRRSQREGEPVARQRPLPSRFRTVCGAGRVWLDLPAAGTEGTEDAGHDQRGGTGRTEAHGAAVVRPVARRPLAGVCDRAQHRKRKRHPDAGPLVFPMLCSIARAKRGATGLRVSVSPCRSCSVSPVPSVEPANRERSCATTARSRSEDCMTPDQKQPKRFGKRCVSCSRE
jgi:hypothetical protein